MYKKIFIILILAILLGLLLYIKPFKEKETESFKIEYILPEADLVGRIRVLDLLKETYQTRDEHFVRGKIINALMYYPRDSIIGFVFNALSDSSLYVQECAAQYLRFNLPFSYYENALSVAQTCSSEKVRSLLFEAALNAIPAYRKALKNQLSFQIHSIITDSPSLYEKQFLIGSLSAYSENALRLMGYYRSLENPILKSAVVQACVRILSIPNSNENSQSFRRLYSFLFDVREWRAKQSRTHKRIYRPGGSNPRQIMRCFVSEQHTTCETIATEKSTGSPRAMSVRCPFSTCGHAWLAAQRQTPRSQPDRL